MNWKVLGLVLMLLTFVGAGVGLLAGTIADESASHGEKAAWAVGCFNGDVSACEAEGEHQIMVREWKSRGIEAAVGSGLLFLLGAALFVGAVASAKPKVEAPLGDELTPEEEAEAEMVERELVLRGAIPPKH